MQWPLGAPHLRMTLEGGVRRGVGPRLLVLMVRLLAERYHRALSRWKYYALCPQSLSLCLSFVVSATAPAFCIAYETVISPRSEIPIVVRSGSLVSLYLQEIRHKCLKTLLNV